MVYFIIGAIYWSYNTFVRKLYHYNENSDLLIWLSIIWFIGWPFCLLYNVIDQLINLSNRFKSLKNKF